ncbi:COG2827 Predicted endonuclease containing a URI domain [uncultured Caudovirales phage]|uniref:COG2827 Predicted endonuclease containing a URI domain n=1 Tax=uncultured Caudovirales phage TaxID=2100421 RepID=A0A6J5S581_9CAUD|nr:COG2827 Predicted endonuclease containing a URI domain [uncultured Caudovirales phage]
MITNTFPRPPWSVYIVKCSDGSLYTGVTTDIERRLAEHNHGAAGAKYTRSRRPVTLVASISVANRSEAQSIEATIKLAPRDKKVTHLLAYAAP